MDALITAAARALGEGDPLGALQRVALREDAPALAVRGIAMAQMGVFAKATQLLRRAARAYGSSDALARARCNVAEAEVALASRDFGGADLTLGEALRTFLLHGDSRNARYTRLLQARRALLLGRVDEAARAMAELDLLGASAMTLAVAHLLELEVALRRGATRAARVALEHARSAAGRARIPSLDAEVEHAARVLSLPAARVIARGEARLVGLDEVEALPGSGHLVVNACRRTVHARGRVVTLSTRPVLFELLRVLAERWPGAASRDDFAWRVFGARRVNASHRVRLRVELGRLRAQLRDLAEIRATPLGFILAPRESMEVRVLAPPIEGAGGGVLALLADGEHWSTSSLALALGASQRTVQRVLSALAEDGQVRALGGGRARRWVAPPVSGFTTTLLLPTSTLFE
ncbi:helix-turn-helix domain-containing protein [Myxococcus sp. K15C18031901]|uniref:helix-turn-helix domain-containing protein n=1 Tax=Myxococcus dinghuensis TaxID=2906761 RepID=UPI0020A6EF37|nr:helix-turn-helix domain-containing protein [Myxococcus dinghuensis]MCP3097300.1 helix-turn-helix domain-containing protein [Myxococcus dinghuensis]